MLFTGRHGDLTTYHSISDLLAQAKCQRCGMSLQQDWSFCPKCGAEVAYSEQRRPVAAGLTLLGPERYELSGVMGGGGERLTL